MNGQVMGDILQIHLIAENMPLTAVSVPLILQTHWEPICWFYGSHGKGLTYASLKTAKQQQKGSYMQSIKCLSMIRRSGYVSNPNRTNRWIMHTSQLQDMR